MNKFCIGIAVVSMSVASAFAGIDGSGTISSSVFSAGNGGEFTITPSVGYIGEMGLPADLGLTSFQTFCVETNEFFNPGNSYDMCINTAAVMGGVGGPSLALDPHTAFLYHEFRFGFLAPFYDYGAGRVASAAELQQAIWFFQGGQVADPGNVFVALANATVSSGAWVGIGDVRILNVYDSQGALHQDQLTIIPTPSAAALAGLGLLAAGRRRR